MSNCTSLEQLQRSCLNCQKCALADTRKNIVFGVGAAQAEVMFIGEAAGEQEDLRGEPFVGAAGKLLDEMLAIIDLERHTNVYITNLVKCRPPKNRAPLNTEQDACIGYLRQQVSLIRPKIIVCLGRVAAMRLIDADFNIEQQHGQWVQRGEIHMTALYHPAALLRDARLRPDTFVDLKSIEQKIKAVCTHTYASCLGDN